MNLTSFNDFKKLARVRTRVPIIGELGELPNDLAVSATPVALYDHFVSEKYSFLLESVERGEKWGRFSFIGIRPSVIFKSKGNRIEVTEGKKKTVVNVPPGKDPLEELKKILFRYQPVSVPGLPRFAGGAVGWISYDTVRFFEKIPDLKKTDSGMPDLFFVIPEILLIVDDFEKKLKIVYDARCDEKIGEEVLKKIYDNGCRLIRQVEKELKKKLKAEKKPKKIKLSWKASLSEKEHAKIVEKTREYIFAGDITQAVLSIRFQAELSKNAPKNKIDPLRLYRSVRQVNPSPYMFILKFGDKSLVGASPETMVRLEEGEMTLRPIAGTRPRGKNQAEDRALEKELLADEKERAEHIMLVDLGRNDLGRVAEAGTVHPDELMTVERYSHVMHIVSNVRAKLAAGKDAFDLLRATFPAGTLSGSPKIRAMGIIEELEPVRRGFYGGCVGYFGFSGNMDMAITIRSAFLERGKITVQSGGGIVADSVPAAEYQEVMNKSKAMRKAIELCC